MTWLLHGVVVVLAARTGVLFARYIFAAGGIQRFHVESAALLFAVFGVLSLIVSAGRLPRVPVTLSTARSRWWPWAVFCALSLALYWPALRVGYLSDDYVLTERALSWNLMAFHADGFRPVPLLIWALLLHAGAGAVGLHLLNLLLHGTNAFLTSRLVGDLFRGPSLPWMAGLVVLTSPLVPEALVWCSGVFDVMATTLVLVAVLSARRYAQSGGSVRGAVFVAAAVLALVCKETAVVIPGLVVADAWGRRAMSKRLALIVGVLGVAFAAYGTVRLVYASPVVRAPLSMFMLQRYVFSIVGSLASPWHVDVVRSWPYVPAVYAAILLMLGTSLFIWPLTRRSARMSGMATGWLFLGALPTFTFLVVGGDLQGARFLYLPTVGWAILLATAVDAGGGVRRTLANAAAAAVLLGLAVAGVHRHLLPWQRAADARSRIEHAALANAGLRRCLHVTLDGLPDSEAGAYVFRNGAEVAFARDIGVEAAVGSGAGGCAFRWDGAAFVPGS